MSTVLEFVRAAAAALQRRDPAGARIVVERALALDPGHGEAWNILGVVRIGTGDPVGAEGAFRHALAGAPANSTYARSRAEALRRQGRPGDACGALAAALRHGALSPDLACDLADLRLGVAGAAAAVRAYRLALVLAPDHARTLNNMAEALRRPEAGTAAGAVVPVLRRLATLRPTAASGAALAAALTDAQRPEEAEIAARDVLRRHPGEPAALEALGSALTATGRHEAAAVLRTAVVIGPDRAGAWGNLGFALLNHHAAEEAERAFSRAVRLKPDLAEAHTGLGTARMLAGRLRDGAASFEWRLRLPAFRPPYRFDRPAWDGRVRPGTTLLVHVDRGLGDAIQFIRYAPALRAAGMRVVFYGQSLLLDLFRASDLVDEACDHNGPPPPHDAHVNVMSLIHLMGTDLDGIPADIPYLRPPEERRRAMAVRTGGLPGLKVGLVWAGSAHFLYDRRRSPGLAPLLPLTTIPGVSVVSLQVGDRRRELATCRPHPALPDWGAGLRDFADTAAVMLGLDMVVSSCTAACHLAGALGRPVAVLLDHGSEWRWLRDREDSPWYPTARLYRQPEPGDWATPVARLRRDLAERAAGIRAGIDAPAPSQG